MKKLALFFLLFLFSCQNEYIEFHENKVREKEIQAEINNFSFDKIEYLTGLVLRETPSLELLDELIKRIDNAKSRVYVEVYIFTEKRLKKSLINAKKRGLDVKVILERNVYLAGNINKDTFKDLEKNGVEVVYSNPENYALNHAKMMIIDDSVIISTGNYVYSTFRYNRDFFLILENTSLVSVFLEVFESDFRGIRKSVYSNNLVLSPSFSRFKLEYLLNNASNSIDIYSHNISDNSILNTLVKKQKSGVKIRVILPNLKRVSSNEDEVNLLRQSGIHLKILDKPNVHAKAILIDGKYLYIGSINFSSPSMDQNREIGLLIKNEDIVNKFIVIFDNDFQN